MLEVDLRIPRSARQWRDKDSNLGSKSMQRIYSPPRLATPASLEASSVRARSSLGWRRPGRRATRAARRRPNGHKTGGPRTMASGRLGTMTFGRDVDHRREPTVGVEPTTCGLQNRCSAAELRWHARKSQDDILRSTRIKGRTRTVPKRGELRRGNELRLRGWVGGGDSAAPARWDQSRASAASKRRLVSA